MKTFRYKLQPYGGMHTRHTCPACGKPRKFVRYIDTITGRQLHASVGRCERSGNCGYHYTPTQYFQDRGEDPDGIYIPCPVPSNPPVPFLKGTNTIPFHLITDLYSENDPEQTHLIRFLRERVGVKKELIRWLITTYQLKAASHDRIIFPQIDANGNCRTAKIMAYNPITGKCIKDQPGSFNWVHSILLRQKKLPEDFHLEQCLFGEHLLSGSGKPVGIVESEKTALICAFTYPKLQWLATGGKYNFSAQRFRPLQNRIIVVIPDAGIYRYWLEKAKEIRRHIRCQIHVSACIEKTASFDEVKQGIDIADLILQNRKPEFF